MDHTLEDLIRRQSEEIDSLRGELHGHLQQDSESEDNVRRLLNKRGLFVVGHARSGTTALMHALNSNPEILVMAEFNMHILDRCPNHYHSYGGSNPLEHYRNRRLKAISVIDKTSFIPPELVSCGTIVPMYRYFLEEYSRFGDKIALSGIQIGGQWDEDLCYDFFSTKVPHAQVFLTLRNPVENFGSYIKMFPHVDYDEAVRRLVRSYSVTLRLHLLLNRGYLVFLDDYSPELLEELSSMVGFEFRHNLGPFGPERKATKEEDVVRQIDLTPELNSLREIYQRMYDFFAEEQSLLKARRSVAFVSQTVEKLNLILGS